MASKRWFEFGPASKFPHPHFNLNLTSVYLFYSLFNLFFYPIKTSAQPAISNQGLETTVYRLLGEIAAQSVKYPDPPTLVFGKKQGKPWKKQGLSLYRTLKSLAKKAKTPPNSK